MKAGRGSAAEGARSRASRADRCPGSSPGSGCVRAPGEPAGSDSIVCGGTAWPPDVRGETVGSDQCGRSPAPVGGAGPRVAGRPSPGTASTAAPREGGVASTGGAGGAAAGAATAPTFRVRSRGRVVAEDDRPRGTRQHESQDAHRHEPTHDRPLAVARAGATRTLDPSIPFRNGACARINDFEEGAGRRRLRSGRRSRPSASTSIRSAAGRSGRPGIRTISPVRATRNPAPAAISTSRTVSVKPRGPAAELGVVGERVLRLGHADRQARRSRACGPCGAWPRPRAGSSRRRRRT